MMGPRIFFLVGACVFALWAAEAMDGSWDGMAAGNVVSSREPVAWFAIRASAATGASPAPGEEKDAGEVVPVNLHDLELVDQDGNKVKFKSEVIGDRVAVVIPFYTTCTTAYPILIFMFTRLQTMLGDHLNKEVVLVSVSVEPTTDTLMRLKAYARRQKAQPGWFFLSGDRSHLGEVLWGVGALHSSNLEEHNHIPVTLVGNARGEWRRFHGFPSPEQVLAEVSRSLARLAAP